MFGWLVNSKCLLSLFNYYPYIHHVHLFKIDRVHLRRLLYLGVHGTATAYQYFYQMLDNYSRRRFVRI